MTTKAARDALKAHLSEMNDAVTKAVKNRKEWMDQHMVDFADFKVGDVVYYVDTGMWAGQISRLYRVHEKDPRFDTSMSIEYEFETSPRCFDNTSRQYRRIATAQMMLDNGWYRVGERELWEKRAENPEMVAVRYEWRMSMIRGDA